MNNKKIKTNEYRILRIKSLSENNFGNVKSVGIKYQNNIGWIATVQFNKDSNIDYLAEDSDNPTEALRKLKNRIKRIINRYHNI